MKLRKLLIIGAGSAIAQETAKLFARNGTELYLVDIFRNRVNNVAEDIRTRVENAVIHTDELNANDFKKHYEILNRAITTMGSLDGILIAHGTLPEQEKIKNDIEQIFNEISTNCLSVISLSTLAAEYFEKQGYGCIAVISSVAGDRGRQSNYIYGTSKGAVSIFMQGLRNRLYPAGVNVVTIKPGLVDTPMTAHLPKNPLYSKPQVIAEGIYKAMIEGKDVVYLPGYWRLIMLIIKMIPEFIFKKLKM
jgi:short-subunit dehydrogenase